MICRLNQDVSLSSLSQFFEIENEVFQRGMIFFKIYKQRFKPCDHLTD